MYIRKVFIFTIVLAAIVSSPVHAGIYTNELSKCLVESTSKEDRLNLVKWLFTAASYHPVVKSISSVTSEQLQDGNQKTAALFMRLLTESCREQTEKALKFEGEITLQSSFQVLGQVAGQELFRSPEVSAAMSGLEQYLDKEKLGELMKP